MEQEISYACQKYTYNKARRGCDSMEKNIAKHVLADVLMITHAAKGEREARLMYELLRGSYRSRKMEWHEECLQAAWEQYNYWLQSNNRLDLPVRSQPARHPSNSVKYLYPIRLEKRGHNEWEFAWPSELLNLTLAGTPSTEINKRHN